MKTALFVAALASPLAGNDEVRSHAETAEQYKALDQIIGAEVCCKPTAEQRSDDEEGGKGEVQDLIILTRDGSVAAAVVSVGGFLGIGDKTVALPISRLSWDGEKETFVVDATEDQLKRLDEFDLDAAREQGLDHAYVTVCESWTAVGFPKEDGEDDSGESSARTDEVTGNDASSDSKSDQANRAESQRAVAEILRGTTCTAIPVSYVCASEMADFPVETLEGEESGSIATCVINCEKRAVEFVVVEGLCENDYLLPLSSLVMCTKDGEDCLCLSHPKSTLETAVKYEEPEEGVLDLASAKRAKDWCKRAAEMDRAKDRTNSGR